ncbi:Target of EGR1, member 1 (Nuclear) [Rhizophlyctis rosea]|nr:Target of EGR1, member 1 (Nuclear) [Rhizophlyctis rosea]
MRKVAKTHALVAFGLTVFEKIPAATPENDEKTKEGLETRYAVHNFEFLMLCQNEYAVNPESMQFLVDNGFDFNEQFRNGIVYTPGPDEAPSDKTSSATEANQIMRSIFHHILDRKVPITLHNGLLDLLFVYNSFYADLPPQLSSFVSDLSEMFQGGIYDTKYIADFHTRENASFLAERQQLDRTAAKEGNYIVCEIRDRLPEPKVQTSIPNLLSQIKPYTGKRQRLVNTGKAYCEQYAAHGYCQQGRDCSRSHDLDVILDDERNSAQGSATNSKKRQKTEAQSNDAKDANVTDGLKVENGSKTESDPIPPKTGDNSPSFEPNTTNATTTTTTAKTTPSAPSAPTPTLPIDPQPPTLPKDPQPTPPSQPHATNATLFEKYHSACFDAYMTGFIYAHQLAVYGADAMGGWKNNLYLMGKQIPLRIEKSRFARISEGHKKKKERRFV